MDQLLAVIRQQKQASLFSKKIILVPSMGAGRQLLLAAAREGIACINLVCETINSLALSMNEYALAEQNLKYIEGDVTRYIILDILRNMKDDEQFLYFNNIEITPGIGQAVYATIMELRLSGHSSSSLDPGAFISLDKGQDMQEILSCYEKALIERSWVDIADLLTIATSSSGNMKDCLLIIPDIVKLSSLENKFINSLPVKKIRTSIAMVYGIENPLTKTYSSGDADKDANQFSWLYAIDQLPQNITDPSISFIQAQGESCEAREIIRRIKGQGIILDKCCIFYTSKEPYCQLFFDLSESLNIPMTFGDGITIGNTYPGRLLSSFIQWIEDGYPVRILSAMLFDGLLIMDEGNQLTPQRAAQLLNESGIGWGRERYTSVIKTAITPDNNEHKNSNWDQLLDFMMALFSCLPDEGAHGVEWAKALQKVLKTFSPVHSPMDGEAKQMIESVLSDIAYYGSNTERAGVFSEVKQGLGEWRVNRSIPKPGHLHITSYRYGIWVNRSFNFIMGLDAHHFPGSLSADPILLDIERKALSSDLSVLETRLKENIYTMTVLLASLKGEVTMSYAALDPVEMQENFPSSLLLHTLRLKTMLDPQLFHYMGFKFL